MSSFSVTAYALCNLQRGLTDKASFGQATFLRFSPSPLYIISSRSLAVRKEVSGLLLVCLPTSKPAKSILGKQIPKKLPSQLNVEVALISHKPNFASNENPLAFSSLLLVPTESTHAAVTPCRQKPSFDYCMRALCGIRSNDRCYNRCIRELAVN